MLKTWTRAKPIRPWHSKAFKGVEGPASAILTKESRRPRSVRDAAFCQITVSRSRRSSAEPSMGRCFELRAQDGGKIIHSEGLLQDGAACMRRRHARASIARRENERTGALGKEIGNRIDLLRAEINIEQRAIDRFARDQIQGRADMSDRTGHGKAQL